MADVVIDFNSTTLPTIPSIITFNQGGWTPTTSGLKSASISNNGLTSGYFKFNAPVGGVVRISMKASSESSYDYASGHLSQSATPPNRNEGNILNISGTQSTYGTYTIQTAGTYYLHFSYAKDGSQTSNSDCAWLVSVTIPVAGGVYTNVGGVWKVGEQMVNANGVWKSGETWVNANGVWKLGQ